MQELMGVLAGMASNGLGGTAVAVTRYAVGVLDPRTLGAFRFGIGFVFLLPSAPYRHCSSGRQFGLVRVGPRCRLSNSAEQCCHGGEQL